MTKLTHEEIAARAFELYMSRPVEAGSATDDWLRAERELTAEREAPATAARRRAVRHVTRHDLAGK